MRSFVVAGGALVCAALGCAPHQEVVPIIHVSPGFENRLTLRPPTGSGYADAAGQQPDAGVSASATESK